MALSHVFSPGNPSQIPCCVIRLITVKVIDFIEPSFIINKEHRNKPVNVIASELSATVYCDLEIAR